MSSLCMVWLAPILQVSKWRFRKKKFPQISPKRVSQIWGLKLDVSRALTNSYMLCYRIMFKLGLSDSFRIFPAQTSDYILVFQNVDKKY